MKKYRLLSQACAKMVLFMAVFFALNSSAKQMYREKTFTAFSSREQTRVLLWTNLMQQMDLVSKKRLGGRIQATASFFTTTDDVDFAKYFGIYNPARNTVESFIGIDQNDINEPLASMNIVHDYARASSVYSGYGLKERLGFKPEKKTLACCIDYVNGFDVFCEGLSLRVSVPFVFVQTSLNPKTLILDARGMNLPGGGKHVTAMDYFSGNIENADPANMQAPLKKLKIPKTFQETKGPGDVEVALRVRLWQQDASHLDVGPKIIIPMGNRSTGEYLFEPLRGNNGHFGVGGELLFDFLAYEYSNISFEVVLNADYTYLLPSDEVRVPLFYDAQGNIPPFAAYQLGGRVGKAGMFPMANELATSCKVSPGHKLEATISCVTSCEGLVLELGAGGKGRSKEHVEVPAWKDDDIGLVAWDYNSTSNVSTAHLWSTASVGPDGVAVNAASHLRTVNTSSLALESITTPSMLSGHVFGFAGYSYTRWPYPLSFGLGGVYELPLSSNASASSWSMFFKFGVNF